MSLSLSAPVRVAAIVLGVVVLGVGYFVLGPGKPGAPQTQHQLIRHPHGLKAFAHKTVATKPKAKAAVPGEESAPSKKTQPATAAPATSHAKPAAKQTHSPAVAKAKPKPKPKPLLQLAPGLPDSLAAALQTHPVVVVSLTNPKAPDDQLAEKEAAAGAALAGVGFVAISVLDQDQVGPITRSVGLVDDPAVLVYQRPGTMIGKLHGYADRETVAQAVQNAAPAIVAPPVRAAPVAPVKPVQPAWLKQVTAVCTTASKSKAALTQKLAIAIAAFQKITPPLAQKAKFRNFVNALKIELVDLQKNDLAGAQASANDAAKWAAALHLPKACA
jgi:hypothetical protein